MKRRSLFWNVYPAFIFVSLLSLIAATLIACFSFKSFYYAQRELDLEERGNIIKKEFSGLIQSADFFKIQKRSIELGQDTQTRYTIIDIKGKVIGDSQKNPLEMDNHKNRFEIAEALQNEKGVSIRYSQTLKKELMYYAMTIQEKENTIGVIRTAIPLSDIQNTLFRIYNKIAISFSILLLIISIVSWKISKWLSLPLTNMKEQAKKLAQGNFSNKVNTDSSDTVESFELGQAINEISVQLNKTIEMMTNQNNEQEAVFSSMGEGVIALDLNQRIIKFNKAAYKILEVTIDEAEGQLLQEVIRKSKFQSFIDSSIKVNAQSSDEILLQIGAEYRYLYVKLGPLFDIKKDKCGTVIVINDITKIKELEQHRKDFVANVSHELRTPLTNIQGFAETLLNPSVKSEQDKVEFIKIIHNHAARLGSIIEDLLALSRLEKETDQNGVKLEDIMLMPILKSSVSLCQDKANERNINIIINCPLDLIANLNPPLIEQAIINLLDNAIKYANENSEINLNAILRDKMIILSVKDEGAGIEKKYLDRLFERFYRVDKARSRKIGGTGLGLSIVKHIALAHGGIVEVESEINKGSTFRISIPTLIDSHH